MAPRQADHLAQLAITADETGELERKVSGPRPAQVPAPRRRGAVGALTAADAPSQNVMVETAGLLVGLVLEFTPQGFTQKVELTERPLSSARERVDPHQLAVRKLV